MSVFGYLDLGVRIAGGAAVPPPRNAGYARQAVWFGPDAKGITVNENSCTFGPVVAPWGELNSFGISDERGDVYMAGDLTAPFTPAVGAIVTAPAGAMIITWTAGRPSLNFSRPANSMYLL